MEHCKRIKLMTEFIHGPVWVYDENGLIDTLSFVEDDPVIQELDTKMADLYTSYYEFDSHGVACWFNKEQQIKDKPIMLELLAKLKARLDEINDGSFEIEDLITPEYENLQKFFAKKMLAHKKFLC